MMLKTSLLIIALVLLIWRIIYLSRQRNLFWQDLSLQIDERLQTALNPAGLRIICNHPDSRHLNFEIWKIVASSQPVRMGRLDIDIPEGHDVPFATFFDDQERQLAHGCILYLEEVMRAIERHFPLIIAFT